MVRAAGGPIAVTRGRGTCTTGGSPFRLATLEMLGYAEEEVPLGGGRRTCFGGNGELSAGVPNAAQIVPRDHRDAAPREVLKLPFPREAGQMSASAVSPDWQQGTRPIPCLLRPALACDRQALRHGDELASRTAFADTGRRDWATFRRALTSSRVCVSTRSSQSSVSRRRSNWSATRARQTGEARRRAAATTTWVPLTIEPPHTVGRTPHPAEAVTTRNRAIVAVAKNASLQK
jgi:hypothetical protein